MKGIARQLLAAGLSATESLEKERMFGVCAVALGDPGTASPGITASARGGSHGRRAFFVPGRIELLGKHTDYAGGNSLLCTAERGFISIVQPRNDILVRITDAASGDSREIPIDPGLEIPRGDWATYVAAVVRRVARDFPGARTGADIAFASDLPQASGMSSSTALTITVFLALDAVNRLSSDPAYLASIDSREALAGYLAAVESGRSFRGLSGDLGVGTMGGSEDHLAILCCRRGFISNYAFAPVGLEAEIPFPARHTLVVAFSGVAAEKGAAVQARYNRLVQEAEQIVALLEPAATGTPQRTLGEVVQDMPDAADLLNDALHESVVGECAQQALVERLRHFMFETGLIIPLASVALGDLGIPGADIFGALVDRSQEGAERLLCNQVRETIALARLARSEDAIAATAFGAGFGGSVWALVRTSRAHDFVARWRAAYERDFPWPAVRAEFFLTRPGPPAMELDITR